MLPLQQRLQMASAKSRMYICAGPKGDIEVPYWDKCEQKHSRQPEYYSQVEE